MRKKHSQSSQSIHSSQAHQSPVFLHPVSFEVRWSLAFDRSRPASLVLASEPARSELGLEAALLGLAPEPASLVLASEPMLEPVWSELGLEPVGGRWRVTVSRGAVVGG